MGETERTSERTKVALVAAKKRARRSPRVRDQTAIRNIVAKLEKFLMGVTPLSVYSPSEVAM